VTLFYLLIAIMPMPRHPFWSRFAGEMTLIKYLGAACLFYSILHLAGRRDGLRFLRTRGMRWFLAFWLLVTLSYYTKSAPFSLEDNPYISVCSFGALLFVTLAVVDSWKRLGQTVLVMIGAVAWTSVYVIREYQKTYASYPGLRPGWVAGDPNYFTLSCLLCAPAAAWLMVFAERRSERIFCGLCLALVVAATTLAASRGGFLGLAAGFAFLALRSKAPGKTLSLVAVSAMVLSAVSPVSPIARLLSPSASDEQSVEARRETWSAGLRMVAEHPLTGVGLGNFKTTVPSYGDGSTEREHVAHNTYLELAAELGLPGVAAFVALLGCAYRSLERVRRSAAELGDRKLYRMVEGLQGGLIGYAVAAAFVSGQYQKLFWLLLFLSFCATALVVERERGKLAGSRLSTVDCRREALPKLTPWSA